MLPEATSLEQLYARFRWNIPARYNAGADISAKWAAREPGRLALICEDDEGRTREVDFAELDALSNRLAQYLAARGVGAGDRVGVLAPQRLETALAHIAILKLGAITMPLFTLFGPEALSHRLSDSGARLAIADAEGLAKLAPLRADLPALETVLPCDGLEAAIMGEADAFTAVDTAAEDPAFLIYTSGTTGKSKGALLPHSTLLGHLPGVEMSHDFLPRPGDRIWTPADWAWIGGLLDVLMPALHHGVPVVARRFRKFTGEAAFDLIRRHGVRNAFIPPTALKMMRGVADAEPVALRSVASGGEALGVELLDWGRKALGVTINEFYGQTECNMVLSSCAALKAQRPGVTGWPVPGHDVAVLNGAGDRCEPGEEGRIAVRRPDPVMMLRYWNREEATREKFRGDWLITGDKGAFEPDGAIRFIGRDDDVITSGGYRIGPGEVEDCLMRHPAVRMAGVVGKPDPLRTESVTAFVVLTENADPSAALAREIADFVKQRLAAHQYPRDVRFVPELPLTATGKVMRRTLREWAQGMA